MNSSFVKSRRNVAGARQDSDKIGKMITVWGKGVPKGINDCTIVLAVDAVAFCSPVTCADEGGISVLKHLKQLEDEELFAHFPRDPSSFARFLREDRKETSTYLCIFHLQSINPVLPCSVVHVYTAENGNVATNTVSTLLRLRDILRTQFHFRVVALAFDSHP
jgi:hypothetical protein